ncbi:MAG: hypothetical protein J0L70_30505 [Leptolyngbya sp. UWPOB_LEPTO1]|uniref:TrbI/VirB10 family protein n=1 Tax=Leptolyngbya sp. UWPOB_LEPTO1 TaxID=2815653 RepID=UPI001AC3023D|nr:TrbI/VirB10 family protein [Leptolyngbya sp. UWPOB_LEPTO1]MBN8564868.1 hypothetical protein [Leptolyngbya sp. UWPOB_LEPTO1]
MQNQSSESLPEQSIQPQDPWNELAELAAMTGYQVEPPPGQHRTNVALLDDEDLEDLEANSGTQTPIWSNPLAKTAFVSTLMATGLGSVGLFIWSLNGNWNKTLDDSKPVATDDDVTPKTNPDQAEIGRLKTVTALGSQAQMLKQAPKTPPRLMPSPNKPKVSRQSKPNTPSISSTSIEPNPPEIIPLAPTYTPARPVSLPVAERLPEFSRAVSPQPVDPHEAWQKAVAVGSYKQDDDRAIASTQPTTSVEQSAQVVADNPRSQIQSMTSEPAQLIADSQRSQEEINPISQDTTIAHSVRSHQQSRYEADAEAILSGTPRHIVEIAPGTISTAKLITPVVWAQDLKIEQQPQRFALQLSQPIAAADGSVVLPAGSKMIAKVDAVSNSGMMQLSVVEAVVPTRNGHQVVEIPAGSLNLMGEGGQPLMAKERNPQKSEIARKDIAISLMGALEQVGSVLNQPSNQTTTTSPYLSTTSMSRGKTNLLGGILQGSFSKLTDRISQRQQRQVEESLQRSNFWYIPAGQTVQVFAASSVEVSR